MKITIDNRDLSYTIDTYGTFTGESTDESEREYLQSEYGLTDDERYNLDFDYDHNGIVKGLAKKSVSILQDELVGHFDYSDEKDDGTRQKIYSGIVKNITLKDTKSPQFYNYTTDSYTAEWDIKVTPLKKFIESNQGDYNNFERDNWYEVYDSHGTDRFDNEKYIVAMLDYWTRQVLTEDSYNDDMWEVEHEIYVEHMTLSDESQKLIDQKAPKE